MTLRSDFGRQGCAWSGGWINLEVVRRHHVGPLPLLALLIGQVACTALPPADPLPEPIEIAQHWSTSVNADPGTSDPSAGALTAWWKRFDDPQLAALVGEALQRNTRIPTAMAAIAQSQALRDQASAALWPTLSGSASAQRGKAAGQSARNSLSLGQDANWPIDVFGAQRAAVDVAQAGVQASQASLGDVQVQVASEVALNYIVLRAAQARTRIAQENLVSQEQTLRITQWRQQAGLLSMLEAAQARAALEQTQALLPALATGIAQTQHALAVLTGRQPLALPHLAEQTGVITAVPQARAGLAMNIPAETLRQRADVRAAEFLMAAALARVDQSQKQRWPSFAIGGSLALNAATVGALSSSTALVTSLLASVTLPEFDGGSLRAQVRQQQAALVQAQQAYRAAVLGALQQVEDALVALQGDQRRLGSLSVAADAAMQADTLARQRYATGLIDFQTVLDTQRTRLSSQDSVVLASADVSSDHVRLFKALGGGWSVATAAADVGAQIQ